ncbi:MAG TPA: serine/threonine-protein kinase [Candidatus Polarisedimenticolaceae bacterium]|nr:serine/threonine-protein kinase [Candidatus Polarisedimenticolaceae bacterium]
MRSCPSCSSPLPDEGRFCGACGFAVASAAADLTRTSVPAGAAPEPRFAPGTMLAGRYRIVGLLGRGGMGEVYRADDLMLARPVALKFLAAEVEHDPRRLGRLLNEVRVALEVSHPNVCRVHDIGETAGLHYISMEYVDGEDLVSLLRRVGHLPQERALRVARQLCAGLAAAHDQGILHRDLKPANVMIDGRGEVKITDFGLAGLAEEIEGAEVRAGTPAYMSPEQLEGREVTVKSDLYALGLVLYEIFTGARAYEGDTLAELRRQRTEGTPTSMNRRVKELDPAVERVVLRCLAVDPASRPASALAVAAALPGGDPLAAALAAGETPSPQLLVEAGAAGGLAPKWALALLALFLVGVAATIAFTPRVQLAGRVPLEQAPEVLAQKAREIVQRIGYADRPADSIYAFTPNRDYLRYLGTLARPDPFEPLRRAQPAGLPFGYRQSPRLLVPASGGTIGDWFNAIPRDVPGVVEVSLDATGRLLSLLAVPHERREANRPAAEPDWRPLLEAAGFDPAALEPVEPSWSPPVYADHVAAWSAVYPDAPQVRVTLHAGALAGRPVWFRIVEPWTRESATGPLEGGLWAHAGDTVSGLCFVLVLVGASWMAYRNLRLGRGDRRTALRFALYLAVARFLCFIGAHHVAASDELELLVGHLAWSLYRFGLVYVFYLALEPYARRLWPRMLVSWVRLFDGRLRDPLVGRDVLIGAVYGLACCVLPLGVGLARAAPLDPYGGPPWTNWWLEALRGPRHALTALLAIHTTSVLFVFVGILLFLVVRVVFRRTWVAIAASTLVALILTNSGGDAVALDLIPLVLTLVLYWIVLFRVGLLAIVLGASVTDLLMRMPLLPDVITWRGAPTALTLLVLVALAGWSFWISLAGRPLFRDELQELESGARP